MGSPRKMYVTPRRYKGDFVRMGNRRSNRCDLSLINFFSYSSHPLLFLLCLALGNHEMLEIIKGNDMADKRND